MQPGREAPFTSGAPAPPRHPKPPTARKYSDKRRQSSKVAARERRSIESDLLQDLGRSLPISRVTINSLDKVSILRLAVANLKLRSLFGANTPKGPPGVNGNGANGRPRLVGWPSVLPIAEYSDQLLNGGFLVVLGLNGELIYVSEAVSECLGLTSYEVTGKSIFDYAHQHDHPDLRRLLTPDDGTGAGAVGTRRTALVRLKCNLFPHLNPAHFRPVSNKVIHLSGRLYCPPAGGGRDGGGGGGPGGLASGGACFVGVGRTIPHPGDHTYPFITIGSRVFTTLHEMNLKIIRADECVQKLLRFSPHDLINRKGVEFVHGADAPQMMLDIHALYQKGQVYTEPYRFLAKNGGWAWAVSEASTLYTNAYRTDLGAPCPPSAVFCRTILISELESPDEIVSVLQVCAAEKKRKQPEGGEITVAAFARVPVGGGGGTPSPQPPSALDASPMSSAMSTCSPASALAVDLFEEFLQSGSGTSNTTSPSASADSGWSGSTAGSLKQEMDDFDIETDWSSGVDVEELDQLDFGDPKTANTTPTPTTDLGLLGGAIIKTEVIENENEYNENGECDDELSVLQSLCNEEVDISSLEALDSLLVDASFPYPCPKPEPDPQGASYGQMMEMEEEQQVSPTPSSACESPESEEVLGGSQGTPPAQKKRTFDQHANQAYQHQLRQYEQTQPFFYPPYPHYSFMPRAPGGPPVHLPTALAWQNQHHFVPEGAKLPRMETPPPPPPAAAAAGAVQIQIHTRRDTHTQSNITNTQPQAQAQGHHHHHPQHFIHHQHHHSHPHNHHNSHRYYYY